MFSDVAVAVVLDATAAAAAAVVVGGREEEDAEEVEEVVVRDVVAVIVEVIALYICGTCSSSYAIPSVDHLRAQRTIVPLRM